MRVDEIDLDHGSSEFDRLLRVEFGGKRVVRQMGVTAASKRPAAAMKA